MVFVSFRLDCWLRLLSRCWSLMKNDLLKGFRRLNSGHSTASPTSHRRCWRRLSMSVTTSSRPSQLSNDRLKIANFGTRCCWCLNLCDGDEERNWDLKRYRWYWLPFCCSVCGTEMLLLRAPAVHHRRDLKRNKNKLLLHAGIVTILTRARDYNSETFSE